MKPKLKYRELIVSAVVLMLMSTVALASEANSATASPAEPKKDNVSAFDRVMAKIKPSIVSIYAASHEEDLSLVDPEKWNLKNWLAPDLTGSNAVSFVSEWAPLKERRHWLGSGLIIDRDGHILVQQEMLKGTNAWEIETQDGRTYAAKWIGSDAKTGYALFRADISDGKPVHFPAAPTGQEQSVDPQTMQRNLGFELRNPSDFAKMFFNFNWQIKGAIVSSVTPGSLADQAGLRIGDSIERVAGEMVDSPAAVFDALAKHDLSEGVELRVSNNEGHRTITMKGQAR